MSTSDPSADTTAARVKRSARNGAGVVAAGAVPSAACAVSGCPPWVDAAVAVVSMLLTFGLLFARARWAYLTDLAIIARDDSAAQMNGKAAALRARRAEGPGPA